MNFLFYATLILFVLLFGTIDCSIDYDFWARLIVGKSYFQTGTLFSQDFYSYGTTHNFVDHEWGSSLIFYLIQNYLGDVGIYIFKSLIIFFTLFLAIKTIQLEKKDVKLNFLFFFFAIQSISYTFFSTIRCQSFSFFFFALYLYLLRRIKLNKEYKLLWCFPLLNIVWANIHGGFVLGLALVLIFAVGEFLNDKKSKAYIYFLMTFLSSALTTLINPYGIEYIAYIIDAFKLNRVHIIEWQSAFFNKQFIHSMLKFKMFFFPAVFLFIYSISKNIAKNTLITAYKNADKTKYLLLLFVTLIALKALRCHVFFTYSVLALCYLDFYNIFNKKLPKILDTTKEVVLFILILISTISHLWDFKFINKVKASQYPIFCVEFLKENNIRGNIFTNLHLGSYVIYKLYPNNHVFMDGRYEEVYDNELINKMGEALTMKNHKEFFKEFHHDILIMENFYAMAQELQKENNWFIAYKDDYFTLYLPNKYKNQKFKLPTKDLNYYNKTKFETSINWLK